MFPVVKERNGKLFHQDLIGRFHFKNHREYELGMRTYLPLCTCGDYIYDDEERCLDPKVDGRNGHRVIHKECLRP